MNFYPLNVMESLGGGMRRELVWFCIILAAIINAVIVAAGYAIYVFDLSSVYAENGLLEQLQVGLLVLSGVSFLLASRQRDNSARLIPLTCGLLCLGFVLRELDVERTWAPTWVKWVGSGTGRDLLLTTVLLVILSYAARYRYYYWCSVRRFSRSLAARLFLLGGGLLVVGDLCEKLSDSIEHSKYVEESIELYGYGFITQAAASALFRLTGLTKPSAVKACRTSHQTFDPRAQA